jgi:hypothetical protein
MGCVDKTRVSQMSVGQLSVGQMPEVQRPFLAKKAFDQIVFGQNTRHLFSFSSATIQFEKNDLVFWK